MYSVKCHKNFTLPLIVPTFYERYRTLFLSNGRKKVAYIKNEFDNSTFRYRCINFGQALECGKRYDLTCFLCSEIPAILPHIAHLDIIVLQRATWLPAIDTLVAAAKRHHIPVIYDMDDLFYKSEHAAAYINHIRDLYTDAKVHQFFGYVNGYGYAMRGADAFIVTTPLLQEHMEKDTGKPVYTVSNFLNNDQITESALAVSERKYCSDKFLIGYFSGSPSHAADFASVEEELLLLMDKYQNISLLIVGFMALSLRLQKYLAEGRVIVKELVPYQTLQYEIASVDVNIIPLIPDVFNEAKSELKYFEAGIVKVPSCASPTAVYQSIIDNGVNGFLCRNGEWYTAIEKLYLNRSLQKSMGEAAYLKTVSAYMPVLYQDKIADVYDAIIKNHMSS